MGSNWSKYENRTKKYIWYELASIFQVQDIQKEEKLVLQNTNCDVYTEVAQFHNSV